MNLKQVIKVVTMWILICSLALSFHGFTEEIAMAASDIQEEESHLFPNEEEEKEEKKEQTIQTAPFLEMTYGEERELQVITDGEGTLTYEINSSSEDIVELIPPEETEDWYKIKAIGVGTAVIKVTAAETESYEYAELEIVITVTKADQCFAVEDMEKKYSPDPFQIDPVLEIGDGKISFSSSDSDIAEIDESGYVTMKKLGSVKLTVTASETKFYRETSQEFTLTIKTNLSKPAISSLQNLGGGIKITWKPVSRAEGYEIYRKVGADGRWKRKWTVTADKNLSVTDTDVKEGTRYYYKVIAYCYSKTDKSEESSLKSKKYLTAPMVTVSQASNGIKVTWTYAYGSSGYYIYRRENSQSAWKKIKTITSGSTLCWKDTSVKSAKNYEYMVVAYSGASLSADGTIDGCEILKSPTVKKISRISATKISAQWTQNTSASGYQIQYSGSRLFNGRKTLTIYGNQITAKTMSGLSKNKTYYVRIRAFRMVNGKKQYSEWSPYKNVRETKTASISRMKKGEKDFELRKYAKQVLYQYDTVQGGCTDGVYGYFVMYDRHVEKCKIVKVKLSNLKVVKISSVLNIAHGNDMTYNSDLKKLVVVHLTENGKRVSFVNPKTLRVESQKDITIPSQLPGATASELKAIKRFFGISYNASRKQYVVFLSKSTDFLILYQQMNVISYVKTSQKNDYTNQSVDTTGDYILLAQSPKGGKVYNILSVYTWDGEYVSKIFVRKGYELENVFHVGKTFYASFYRSYYKTYYTKEKVKMRVKGKMKKVTVKVRHKKLMRDNYLYKIGTL